MKTNLRLCCLFASLIFLTECAKRSVTRVSPDQQIDLSGNWNDTDSKLVAEEMTRDMMARTWRNDFSNKYNKKPVIIVGMITNKSHEHIEAETFIKNMERELINAGNLRIVQNSQFREKLREERADQQQFSSSETQKKWGKELGADFMVFGNINSIVDAVNKKKVVYYQVNLELTDMETNEIVWIGEKKIKKFVNN